MPPYCDPLQLEHWGRTVIGDTTLANQVRNTAAQEKGQQQVLSRMRNAIGMRIVQCLQVIAVQTSR